MAGWGWKPGFIPGDFPSSQISRSTLNLWVKPPRMPREFGNLGICRPKPARFCGGLKSRGRGCTLGIPARGFAAEIPQKPRESASLGLSSALSCSRASLPGPPQTAAPKSKEFPSIRAKTPIYSLRFSSETSKPKAAGFNARRFHDFCGLEPLFSSSSPRLPGFFHNREFNGSTLACTK